MGYQRVNPNQTAKTLKTLLSKKLLTEAQFQSKHHLGASSASFVSYCGKVKSFTPGGNNEAIHEWLQQMLRKA